jgi:Chaperone of endosialidase
MASIVSAGTTSGTALNMSGDTSGVLQLASNNGTTAVTIDTSQNVGIGTSPTSPFKLSVGGRVSVSGSSYTTSPVGLVLGQYDASTVYIQKPAGYSLAFWDDATNAQMVLNSSGNVGIGTNSPGAQVDISRSSTGGYSTLRLSNTGASGKVYEIGVGGNAASAGYANNLYFYDSTASAIRMVLDNSGNLLVGTTSVIGSGRVSVLATSSTNGINCQANVNANSVFGGYNNSASATFYVTGTGQIYSTSTSISAISDQSQKENVVTIPYGLAEVEKLKPVKFDFKEGCASEEKGLLGFIAQDVENVLPELVKPFGNDGLLGLKMGDMLPVLVKAIQELKAINDTQAETINALTARVVALEAK